MYELHIINIYKEGDAYPMWYLAQVAVGSRVVNEIEVHDRNYPDDPDKKIKLECPTESWVIRITPYAHKLNLKPGMAVYCEFLPAAIIDDPEAIENLQTMLNRYYSTLSKESKERYGVQLPIRLPFRTVRVVREHGGSKSKDQPAALAISCKKACRVMRLGAGEWIAVRILGVVMDTKDLTHQTEKTEKTPEKTYHRVVYRPDKAFYRFKVFECIPVPVPDEAPAASVPDPAPDPSEDGE